MSTFLAQARPIDRESLSRRVYRDLRDMLISGQLQPGERLTLDGVAKALGTSHMPVREAMRQLAAERVAKTTDVVKEGDKVWVKLLGFDERGKVRLSMKVVDQATGKELAKGEEAAE